MGLFGGLVVVAGIIERSGKLLTHLVKAFLVCWRRMLRFGLSVGAIAFVSAEVIGILASRRFPPSGVLSAVALLAAFAFGYSAALTVLIDELFFGAIELIGMVEGDIRAGMRAATVAAERAAGEAGNTGLMRFLGHPKAPKPSSPQPGHEPMSQHDDTLREIQATDEFITTAPRPAIDARPVRADRLPRITWALDAHERP